MPFEEPVEPLLAPSLLAAYEEVGQRLPVAATTAQLNEPLRIGDGLGSRRYARAEDAQTSGGDAQGVWEPKKWAACS